MSTTTQSAQVGPWRGAAHNGRSGARYFAIERDNPKGYLGVETMLMKGSWMPRRFKTLEAAQKAADKANAALAKVSAS